MLIADRPLVVVVVVESLGFTRSLTLSYPLRDPL